MGPSGTFVSASFAESQSGNEEYEERYATLLRNLLDRNLFPPCGAPLDSVRERKHGHSILVHKPSRRREVSVESNLAADGSAFCSPHFILDAWGKGANGPCHESDNWGLFDSLFGRPVDGEGSQPETLANLLLGLSNDFSGGGVRHSIWVEVHASPECFSSGVCTVNVTRGVSYRIGLPSPISKERENAKRNELTLGDLLLGRSTLQQLVAKEGWKAWYPCPLSDSSKIVLFLSDGYEVMMDGEKKSGRIEIDAMAWKEGYMDLTESWAELYLVDGYDANSTSIVDDSTFGISRTVQRPLGISGPGTLVSVVRYANVSSSSSPLVRVESLDVFPGHLIKPKIHTLRMVLYQGGGAGGSNFVPIGGYDYDACVNDEQCGSYNQTALDLRDLQDYSLTRLSDGTILVERTLNLLSPDSSVWMMVDYDEAYLPFQKFPADANRGVDVFPSRATFTPIAASSSHPSSTTLYSTSLLILPPVPDMSMPFNVISLSCTLWAFVLGSMINILVKRSTESVKRELTGEKEKRPIEKLKDKICEKGAKLRLLFKKLVGSSRTKRKDETNIIDQSQAQELEDKKNI
jgi:hypothetical protein